MPACAPVLSCRVLAECMFPGRLKGNLFGCRAKSDGYSGQQAEGYDRIEGFLR